MNDKTLLNDSANSEVVARPGGQLWVVFGWLALASAVLGAGAICEGRPLPSSAQEPILSPRVLIAGMSLLSAAGALFLLASIRANRVVASSSGICRRRLLRGEIVASWEQVTDYYAAFSRYNIPELRIETTAGMIILAPHWRDAGALKAMVEKHATQARARTWETRGARMCDMPQAFDYSLSWLVSSYPPFLVVPLIMLLAGASMLTVPPVLEPAGFGLWLPVILMLPIVLLIGIPVWLELKRRRRQRLLAKPDGLEFSDGTKSVSATWEEVTRLRSCFSRLLPTYIVETAHGDFEFSILIRNLLPLLALLRSVTHRGTRPVELAGDGPDTSPESAARLEFRPGSTFRSMMLMPAGLLFCAVFAFVLGCLRDKTSWPPEASFMVWGAVLSLAIWGGMAAWFSRARLTVREDGLRKCGLFREQLIRWDDVREFYLTGPALAPLRATVVGANGSIKFLLQVTDRNLLLEEIARRSVKCSVRTWEHRVTTF